MAGPLTFTSRSAAHGSGKIVATHGVAGAGVDWRHPGRNALAPREVTTGVQERNQSCQRKGFVAALRYLIEFNRQLRLARERAMPLAILVQDPTKFPLRQFERDQGEYGVDAGTGFDQPSDPACCRLFMRSEAPARLRHHLGHEFRRQAPRASKLRRS